MNMHAESSLLFDLQDFEHLQENNHTSSEVELKILLPDRSLCVVKINRNDTADEVFKVTVDEQTPSHPHPPPQTLTYKWID